MKPLLIAIALACLNFTFDPGKKCCTSKKATCTGSKSCNACKNCKYCKHCSKDGGSCGVCRSSKVSTNY